MDDFSIRTNQRIYFINATHIEKLPPESIQLIVTSPPYWRIKDYGKKNQIGYHDSLTEYLNKLGRIWNACYDALCPGCKMVINIGDQFLRAKKEKSPYQIIPLHAMIINDVMDRFKDKILYLGSINWSKVSTSNTSGGGHVMGSIYFPRNGYFFINREYIMIFKKAGKDPRPNKLYKPLSRISLEEWRLWFKDTWTFPGVKMTHHIAMFPEELPKRIIQMYSFVGDTVLDPFTGSGTTNKVATELGRHSIGFELGFETKDGNSWKEIIKNKIEAAKYPDWVEPKFIYHDSL